MKAKFRTFSDATDVAKFLTKLGRDRVIAVHRDDQGISVGYTIWFWEAADGDIPKSE